MSPEILTPEQLDRLAAAIAAKLARPLTIPLADVPRYCGVSGQTLLRKAKAGCQVGLLKLNGRTVFHLETLEKYLASEVARQATGKSM
jgi:hypothetical protein